MFFRTYAWGKDEVSPISMRGNNRWGGYAVTMVDSLDTLWLVGMKEEFGEARSFELGLSRANMSSQRKEISKSGNA